MKKLNGWQRLYAVATAVWLLFVLYLVMSGGPVGKDWPKVLLIWFGLPVAVYFAIIGLLHLIAWVIRGFRGGK